MNKKKLLMALYRKREEWEKTAELFSAIPYNERTQDDRVLFGKFRGRVDVLLICMYILSEEYDRAAEMLRKLK